MHQKENTTELLKHAFSWQQPTRGIAAQLAREPLPGDLLSSFSRVSCLRPHSRFPGDARLSALTLGSLQRIPAPGSLLQCIPALGTARSRQHHDLWSCRLRHGAESHGHSLYLCQQMVTKMLPRGTEGWPQRWRRWLLQILAAVMDHASNWQPVSVE